MNCDSDWTGEEETAVYVLLVETKTFINHVFNLGIFLDIQLQLR